jgi:hypothetical protein
MARRTRDPKRGLAAATVAAGTRVRTRAVGMMLAVRESDGRASAASLRNDLARVGVPRELIDAKFVRRLERAAAALLERATTEDASLLDRIARDPVAAYRTVDPEVAEQLARVLDAARAGTTEPPDLGPVPEHRRPPRAIRPVVRAASLETAVGEVQVELMAWVAADPARARRLRRNAAGVLAEVTPDLAPAVRDTVLARLGPRP